MDELLKPILIAAFTHNGIEIAIKLAEKLDNAQVFVPSRFASAKIKLFVFNGTVFDWVGEWFIKARAFIFISSVGIAIRAVAPYLKNKTTDPAVIALDDTGQNVIPLLSGHIGGGNRLAAKIAEITGGRAVITTATDVHNIEAVDEWAIKNNCAIENPEAIKFISATMLEKEILEKNYYKSLPHNLIKVGVAITDEIFDELPPPWPVTLWLRPRVLVLGIGCKRGIEKKALDFAIQDFLNGAGKSLLSLKSVASINLKRDERAIINFCQDNNISFLTYSAEELNRVPGHFSLSQNSQKILNITGTDNVCERAAVLAAGNGTLLRSKTIYPGLTLALARTKKCEDLSN